MSSTLRCLKVMELLAQEPYTLTLTEIARRLSTSPGTAHRFVSTLIAAGLISRDAEDRQYFLTGKALWIGAGFLRHSEAYRSAYTMLGWLSRQTMLMAYLGIWDCDLVLYLHSTAPAREADLCTEIGGRRPVHSTALGKTLLAYRTEEDLVRLFSRKCERFTDNTITTIEAMREHLELIRGRGYAVDDEEGSPGLRCVAAPVFDRNRKAVAAISVSGPTAILCDSEIPRLGRLVREATLRASVHLGYRPPANDLAELFAPATAG